MENICEWNNCNNKGKYKAPTERDNSKKFRLLCLNHIKIFNKNWNYFENMNDQEIEFFIKSDLTWHKSTKNFGSSENFFNILWNNALDDKLNIFKSSNFKEFKKITILIYIRVMIFTLKLLFLWGSTVRIFFLREYFSKDF